MLHAGRGSSTGAALTRTLAGVSFSQQTCRNEAQPSAGPLRTPEAHSPGPQASAISRRSPVPAVPAPPPTPLFKTPGYSQQTGEQGICLILMGPLRGQGAWACRRTLGSLPVFSWMSRNPVASHMHRLAEESGGGRGHPESGKRQLDCSRGSAPRDQGAAPWSHGGGEAGRQRAPRRRDPCRRRGAQEEQARRGWRLAEPEEAGHPREHSGTQASLCLRPQEEKQLEDTQVRGGGGGTSPGVHRMK